MKRKVLVTGGAKGIGKAITKQLANEGFEVVIHFFEESEAAEALATEINTAGGCAHLVHADFRDYTQAIALGHKAWVLAGGLDYLINNAGVSYKKAFLEQTPADFDFFNEINLKSTLFLTQTIAAKMVAAGTGGGIYTITSINGLQPGYGFSVYGATKGALETLMKGVALELAAFDINVNTIALGAIQTDMNARVWQDEDRLAQVNSQIPMGRLGQPEEVARVISGLLTTTRYMTGTTIKIDGGWTLKQGFSAPEAQ